MCPFAWRKPSVNDWRTPRGAHAGVCRVPRTACRPVSGDCVADNATAMARIEQGVPSASSISERAVLPFTRRRPQGFFLVWSQIHACFPSPCSIGAFCSARLASNVTGYTDNYLRTSSLKERCSLIYQIVGKPLTALFRVFRRYKNTDDQIQEHGRTLVLMLPPTPTPPTPPTPTPPRGPRSRRDDHRVLQHTR